MRILSTVIIAISLSFAASCGEGDGEKGKGTETKKSETGSVTSWPATRATGNGSFEVTLNPAKGKVEKGEHFSLDVSLKAVKGTLEQVTVVVDADMPAHRHGMNTQPKLTVNGPSKYGVEGMRLHMAGDWIITVDVKRGGNTERASFPVSVE